MHTGDHPAKNRSELATYWRLASIHKIYYPKTHQVCFKSVGPCETGYWTKIYSISNQGVIFLEDRCASPEEIVLLGPLHNPDNGA